MLSKKLVEKNMDVLRTLEGPEIVPMNSGSDFTLDENAVNQMIDLSGEEVKLCRNFEDRLNTMILRQSAKPNHGVAPCERSPVEDFASV